MRLAWLLVIAALLPGCWGSPVSQDPGCAAWVRCTRALDLRDGRPEADVLRFEEGGGCWENPEFAKGCITACGRALERLRARDPSLPGACVP
jgi:hypothetical protein